MSASPSKVNWVKQQRLARGWSQVQLADMAGISRTGLGAIESNRLVPSVSAAIALASALETNVEALFSAGPALSESAAPVWAWRGESKPYRYWSAEVEGRLVLYPVEPSAGIAIRQDGSSEGEHPAMTPSNISRRTLVMATCDPAAGYLAVEYARQTPFRLLVFNRPSRDALELLDKGLIHVAGIHLAEARAEGGNASAVRNLSLSSELKLFHVADWEEGLALAPGLKVRTARQIAKSRFRWIGRTAGAGARRCQDEVRGDQRPPNRTARDHRGVISAIQSGYADVGVCVRLVADEGRVGFLPICIESYDLAFRRDIADDPRVTALLQVVRSAEYRSVLAELPGYFPPKT